MWSHPPEKASKNNRPNTHAMMCLSIPALDDDDHNDDDDFVTVYWCHRSFKCTSWAKTRRLHTSRTALTSLAGRTQHFPRHSPNDTSESDVETSDCLYADDDFVTHV